MKRKIVIGFALLGILGFLVSGSSLAYFTSDIGDYDLTRFSLGSVKISVDEGADTSLSSEDFVERRKLEWKITNEGTNDIRLKARVIESGHDQNENIDLSSRDGWKKSRDGDYYYGDPVEPGEAVVFPLDVFFNTWNPIEDYGINIEAEAIQASNDAIDYKWVNH